MASDALKIVYGYHPLLVHAADLERKWPFDAVPRSPGHEAVRICRGENPYMQQPPDLWALEFSNDATAESKAQQEEKVSAKRLRAVDAPRRVRGLRSAASRRRRRRPDGLRRRRAPTAVRRGDLVGDRPPQRRADRINMD